MAVGVLQLDGEFRIGYDFVAVGFTIAARSDPFEVDGLPGSVDGTVGKQSHVQWVYRGGLVVKYVGFGLASESISLVLDEDQGGVLDF